MNAAPEIAATPAPGLSVVVPVFDSAGTLTELVARLGSALDALGRPYELILVDDGSRDDSWAVISNLAGRYAWIRGIGLMRNYGQHNALLAGIRAARFDVTVTMDDDLQHRPETLAQVLALLDGPCDVVYATPEQKTNGFLRAVAGRITRLALRSAVSAEVARNVSAYRAFRTELRQAFSDYESPFVSVDVLLTWATTRFGATRVRFDERLAGRSNYTVGKLLGHALDMMTGFSSKPLKFASLVGFAFTIFGVAVLAYVLIRYFLEGSIPGFPFLASLISVFAGAQLFALGVIGEYLARMHFRSMKRPVYVVRNKT